MRSALVPIACLNTCANFLEKKWPMMADTLRGFAMSDFAMSDTDLINSLKEENAKLREILRKIAEDDWPVVRAHPYRRDGVISKCDKCPHDLFIYEGCVQCLEDFARAELEKINA